ncbi:hypothetical protein PMAG_a1834 [Pseudoalteromonas mariniglutinosa NCIMB 1770]|nr:hypothetical protein [Pseudoalteromonas mariniglutinosa NCIMB 1770]
MPLPMNGSNVLKVESSIYSPSLDANLQVRLASQVNQCKL